LGALLQVQPGHGGAALLDLQLGRRDAGFHAAPSGEFVSQNSAGLGVHRRGAQSRSRT
jgi:hypothetical protein